MRWFVLLLALAACAHHAVPPAPMVVRAVAAPRPAPIWPVPVRVMEWTDHGEVQVGELPDAPPAALPATPWYVEPTRTLDRATFERLVAAVRHEHVPGLSLRGQPAAGWLGELRDLPQLRALILDDTDVGDAALDALALPLARIYLARTAVTDTGVARLVVHEPALEVIDLEGTAIGDAAARALAGAPGLHAVDLAGTRLTDAGGAALGALAALEVVDLGRTQVGAQTIAALRPLALRELFVDHTHVGPELATLGGYAPGLVRLDVSSLAAYKPTDRDLAWLAHAPNLVEAGLSGARVDDALVTAIAALPNLRDLRLADTPITIAAIRAIARRTDLEQLDLADTPVDDASAAQILASPALRFARLDGTPIDDAALPAQPGAALTELYVSSTRIDDAGTALLDALPELVGLGLGETQIGDATLARIAHLSALRTLVLSKTHASATALAQLGALHALERLYVDRTAADDSTLDALAGLHALRVLHLAASGVTDRGLPALRRFTRLEELTLGNDDIGAAACDLRAWPRLRVLSLVGLDLDDTALPGLAAHAALAELDLSYTSVTDPAPLAALPALRELGLAMTQLSSAGEASVTQLASRGVRVVR
jgi:Leucine-rich repeat (LRR) protein